MWTRTTAGEPETTSGSYRALAEYEGQASTFELQAAPLFAHLLITVEPLFEAQEVFAAALESFTPVPELRANAEAQVSCRFAMRLGRDFLSRSSEASDRELGKELRWQTTRVG
jgi:hypothetical protein